MLQPHTKLRNHLCTGQFAIRSHTDAQRAHAHLLTDNLNQGTYSLMEVATESYSLLEGAFTTEPRHF